MYWSLLFSLNIYSISGCSLILLKLIVFLFQGKRIVIEYDEDFKAPYRYASKIKEKGGWQEHNDDDQVELQRASAGVLTPSYAEGKDKNLAVVPQVDKNGVQMNTRLNLGKSRGREVSETNVSSKKVGPESSVCLREQRKTKSQMSLREVRTKSRTQDSRSVMTEPGEKRMKRESNVETGNVQPLWTSKDHQCQTVEQEIEKSASSESNCTKKLLKSETPGEVSAVTSTSGTDTAASTCLPLVSHKDNLPVRVKTFKFTQVPDRDVLKAGDVLRITEQNDPKDEHLQVGNIPLCGKTRDSHLPTENKTVHRSISLLPETCSTVEKTVVIQLYSLSNGSLSIGKITQCTLSDGEELPNVTFQKDPKTRNDDDLPTYTGGSNSQNMAHTENLSSTSKIGSRTRTTDTHCHENKKGREKSESPAAVPSAKLEGNLSTNITFLTDCHEQQQQQVSSRISAAPGVMTRDLLDLDYSNGDYFSSTKVRQMMKKGADGRVTCRQCGRTTTYRAFYKHARKHFNIKPFKCGYCPYRSIEKGKVRVHHTFCHPMSPCIILLSTEMAGNDKFSNLNHSSNKSQAGGSASSVCNNSRAKDVIATTVLSTSVNPATVFTGNASTTVSLDTSTANNQKLVAKNLPTHEVNSPTKTPPPPPDSPARVVVGAVHQQPVFKCPLCQKLLRKHTPSNRRHLYRHYGYKPYKCGYCTFTGTGQGEVSLSVAVSIVFYLTNIKTLTVI